MVMSLSAYEDAFKDSWAAAKLLFCTWSLEAMILTAHRHISAFHANKGSVIRARNNRPTQSL